MNDAYVTCVDGRIRKFVSSIADECLHYEGRKYVYVLWPEPEGRGFIVMTRLDGNYVLAPRWIQPLFVEAKTWAGRWNWVPRPPLTREFLLSRGKCCNKACVNCPWKEGEMQNGKGDSPRPVDKDKFDRNFDEIRWNERCSGDCKGNPICDRHTQKKGVGSQNESQSKEPESLRPCTQGQKKAGD